MPGTEPKLYTIQQITGNFYGGLAFVANWNFNDGSSPSTLTVSVVNSGGNYSITDADLTYASTVAVGLGSFSFNGYLVGYEIEESAQQTILTLEYIDKSVDLERWSVGLNGRHGQNGTGPANMILVGREFGPCDSGLDSTQEFAGQSNVTVDPCDPCPNMPANGYKDTCKDAATNLKIFPVYYTFNELLGKLGQTGLGIVSPTDLTGAISNHRAQHTGTVKSVISNWCGELGLSYYFDPVTQNLTFVNRNTPISIPNQAALKVSGTVSLKYGATKSKTFSRGYIGYLGTQGDIKDYSCEREDAATLFPLGLGDLLSDDGNAAAASQIQFNVQAGGNYDANYTWHPPAEGTKVGQRKHSDLAALWYSTVLAYYPSQVRLSFLWFEQLGIYDQNAAQKWRVAYKSPNGTEAEKNTDGTTPNAGTIYELGNMNIVKVISKQNPATAYEFDCLAKLGAGPYGPIVPESYLQYVNAEDRANNRNPESDPSFYFILAQCNTDLLNKQEARDVSRAKQFLGRYYYRTFDAMAVAGGSNDNGQLNIDAAGASATYHPRGESVHQLPIFSFGHTDKSRIGQILSTAGKDEADNLSSMGNNGSTATTGQDKYRSLKSFILLDRGDAARYEPDEAHIDDWGKVWEWYKNITPQLVGNDGRPEILVNALDANAGADSSLKLFIVRSVDSGAYKITVTDNVPHPREAKQMKTRHRSYEGIGDATGNGTEEHPADGDDNAQYGLQSANTIRIDMPGGLTVHPPAQSFTKDGMEKPGFRVFIKSSSKYQKVIPKFQKVLYKDAPGALDVAQVDYIHRELSAENLQAITNTKQCLPTDAEMTTYVTKFAQNIAIQNSQVSKKANLKMIGIMPTAYNVSQGLSSVQITLGENGVYTDYTFEDKIVIPPAEDVIAEQIIRQNRVAPSMGSSLQKMNSAQFGAVERANTAAATFNTTAVAVT
jgi:hypothetical protein